MAPPAHADAAQYVVEADHPTADAVCCPATSAKSGRTSLPAQLGRASSWGFAGRAVLLLANFGSAPFTIRLLGPSAYGLWALVQTIIQWMQPAEGGQSAATTKYGSERFAAADAVGESKVIWSGLYFILMTTGTVAVALALVAHFVLVLLRVQGNLVGAGTWALRVACGTLVVSSLAGAVNTAQQARLRWRQFTLFNMLSNVLGAVGVPLAIFLFAGGVVTAAAVGLLAAMVYFLGLSWDALRVQPILRRPRVDRATLRQLVSYGWALALAGVANVPLSTGERFFLAAHASTKVVAYYAVAMTVATTLEVLPQQICSPLMPALSRLQAEGRQTEHRALYAKSLAGLFLVLSPAAILVGMIARPFLALWAGPAYGAHGALLLLIALVGMWANALAWVPSAYILSSGKTKTLAILQVAELPCYLGAAWVLTAKWGAVGAACVWSGRLVFDSVAHSLIVRRSAGLPVLPLSARRLRSVGTPLALAGLCVAVSMATHGLLARSGGAAVLALAYAVIIWRFVLTRGERRGVVNLLTEMLGRDIRVPRNRPAHALK